MILTFLELSFCRLRAGKNYHETASIMKASVCPYCVCYNSPWDGPLGQQPKLCSPKVSPKTSMVSQEPINLKVETRTAKSTLQVMFQQIKKHIFVIAKTCHVTGRLDSSQKLIYLSQNSHPKLPWFLSRHFFFRGKPEPQRVHCR